MSSWTCGLCDTDKRWPTKEKALEHIRENHLDSLVRASLERSNDDPTEELDVEV